MTNLEKIRRMSVEEYADLFLDHDTLYCEDCIAYDYCKPNCIDNDEKEARCVDVIREWLNMEADDGQ